MSEKLYHQEIVGENEPAALKDRIHHELSLEEKRGLLQFFAEKGGKNEFDAYGIFVSDVKDGEPETIFQPEEMLSKVPNISYLGNLPDGFNLSDSEDPIYKPDTTKPLAFDDRSFIHIRLFGPHHEAKSDREIAQELYCRFYVCPESKQLPEILPKLIEKYQEKELRLTAKFAKSNQRNDRMIIYCDAESASNHLEALEELVRENPDLFQNLGRNRLWNPIKGVEGIYFGQENPNQWPSYSADRAMAVGEAFCVLDSMGKNGQEINDQAVEYIFNLCTLEHRIDPKSWGEYSEGIDIDQIDQIEDTLYDLRFPEK